MSRYFVLVLLLFSFFTACSSSDTATLQLSEKEQNEIIGLLDMKTGGGISDFFNDEVEKSTVEDRSYNKDKVADDQTAPIDGVKNNSPKRKAKLIKDARISYQVKSYTKAKPAILQLIQQSDAYLAEEQESGTRGNHPLENHLSIRVKAAEFDRLIAQLMELALYVDYKNIVVKDITEQYLDMDARLSARKAVEQRYVEILKEAKNVKEILQVEEKLQNVREDIESAQGKLKYWDNKVGYSTIALTFYELRPNTIVRSNGFLYQIERGLRNGWEGVLITFIGLVNVWPLLIIGVILALLLRRRFKRKRG